MATFSSTIVNTVVGVLNNGKKLVSTTANVHTGVSGSTATITIRPVTRVLSWVPTHKQPGATSATSGFTHITYAAATANTITASLGHDASGAVIEITSVGI